MRVPELLPIAVPSLDGYEATGAPAPPSRVGIWLVEWVVVVVLALVLAVGVRTYVAQMFYIPSGSMLPTLQIGDRIVVDKLSYRLHPVHRGDVVVFRRPPLEHANYSDLVKRVIGLPGETVSSVDGQVYIDGKPLDEPFDGFYSARRGTYRIIYRIDAAKHLIEIHSIRHRRDAYQ